MYSYVTRTNTIIVNKTRNYTNVTGKNYQTTLVFQSHISLAKWYLGPVSPVYEKDLDTDLRVYDVFPFTLVQRNSFYPRFYRIHVGFYCEYYEYTKIAKLNSYCA